MLGACHLAHIDRAWLVVDDHEPLTVAWWRRILFQELAGAVAVQSQAKMQDATSTVLMPRLMPQGAVLLLRVHYMQLRAAEQPLLQWRVEEALSVLTNVRAPPHTVFAKMRRSSKASAFALRNACLKANTRGRGKGLSRLNPHMEPEEQCPKEPEMMIL